MPLHVIAPTCSATGLGKARGDYSLGAFASGIRDLLGLLGFESATVVGHSLGGGIAMQLSYQFPEYCERLVLISSGGWARGKPGAARREPAGSELVMPLIVSDWGVRAGGAVSDSSSGLACAPAPSSGDGTRLRSLVESDSRLAFIHTLRSVIDSGGQKVSALDRLYLAERIPVLIIWGDRDPIIPVEHGRRAHAEIPHSRFVEIPDARHWPQLDQPRLVCKELSDFISGTKPFRFDPDLMREQLRQGPPAAS